MTYIEAVNKILEEISVPTPQKWVLLEELKKVAEELDDNSE